jgi:hypothetical protein
LLNALRSASIPKPIAVTGKATLTTAKPITAHTSTV